MPATPPPPRFAHALATAFVVAAVLVAAGVLAHLAGDASPAYRALRVAMLDAPDRLWSGLTFFGFGITAAIVALLVPDRSMRFVAVSLWSVLFTTIAVQGVKRMLVTPRPLTLLPDLVPIGDRLFWGSMPSGHAAAALALATGFVLLRSRSWRSVAVVAALATAVAVSRIAVGAHWIGDVLVGSGLGVVATALGVVVERRVDLARRLATPYGQLGVAALQLATGALMLWRPLGYPLAQPLQWLLGAVGIAAGLHRLWTLRAPTARAARGRVVTSRQAIGGIAGLALGALLLWLLLRGASVSRWLEALGGVPPMLWVAATLGLLASYALRALRLFVEWQPQVRGIRFVDCLRLMLLHNAAVNVVPMRAGEAGYAWIVHRQWGVPLADAVASLLWLRLQGRRHPRGLRRRVAAAGLGDGRRGAGADLDRLVRIDDAAPRLAARVDAVATAATGRRLCAATRPGRVATTRVARLRARELGGQARRARRPARRARRPADPRRLARQPRRRAGRGAAGAGPRGTRHLRGRRVGRRRPAHARHLARPRRRRCPRGPPARPRRRPRRGARRTADDGAPGRPRHERSTPHDHDFFPRAPARRPWVRRQ